MGNTDPDYPRSHRSGIVSLVAELAFLIPLAIGVSVWGNDNAAITMGVAAGVAMLLFFRRTTSRSKSAAAPPAP